MGKYGKENKRDDYRKELLKEAEKYLPAKITVNIYPGFKKEAERAGIMDMPVHEFMKNFKPLALVYLKEGADYLISKGVRPERPRKLTLELGKEGKMKTMELEGKEVTVESMEGGYHEKGGITFNYNAILKGRSGTEGLSAGISAHEMVHLILDRSAFGQYQGYLVNRFNSLKAAEERQLKSLNTVKDKFDRVHKAAVKAGELKTRADYENLLKTPSPYSKAFEIMGKQTARTRSLEAEKNHTLSKFNETRAVNEAVAFAVYSLVTGTAKSKPELLELDKTYGAPISKFYTDAMELMEKKGVKKTIEAVRKLNPRKAEKDKRYYSSFDQMRDAVLAKA